MNDEGKESGKLGKPRKPRRGARGEQRDRQTIRLLAWLESRKAQGRGVHARTNKKEKEGLFPKLIKTIRRDASKASPSDTPL